VAQLLDEVVGERDFEALGLGADGVGSQPSAVISAVASPERTMFNYEEQRWLWACTLFIRMESDVPDEDA
jgi:hypothetical protein